MKNKEMSNVRIMLRMLKMVKPLAGFMFIAVTMGVVGYLCAIMIPVMAVNMISHFAQGITSFPYQVFFVILIVIAIARGVLHYLEQACNHYIAFTLLAIFRDKVFMALRKLTPAKLEGKDKGNLIAIITSDIELLEVFYAHTISPIIIAAITCLILLVIQYRMHPLFAVVALLAYCCVGIVIPILNGKKGKEEGKLYRSQFGDLNTYQLESLRGMQTILQYGIGEQRLNAMHEKSEKMNETQKVLKGLEGESSANAAFAVSGFSLLMFFVSAALFINGDVSFIAMCMSSVLMFSSFGPVLALSSLSNNLMLTMASARRVIGLLDEKPIVSEIQGQKEAFFDDIDVDHVTFSYGEENILDDFTCTFKKGKITGILGKSGSGKSTLLKLLMRFWKTDQGTIRIGDRSIDSINTSNLRDFEGYVTQDTVLFHDTIFNNLRIAKLDATKEEIMDACKKANIHDFIMRLPQQYETRVEELGESLSGGERQRIALARVFLHDAQCILLDEPTSNLDALNEAEVLKTLKEQKNKTILLVSHRKSTLRICDELVKVENGRVS